MQDLQETVGNQHDGQYDSEVQCQRIESDIRCVRCHELEPVFLVKDSCVVLFAEVAGLLCCDPALADTVVKDHDTYDDAVEHTDSCICGSERGCLVIVPVTECIVDTCDDLRDTVRSVECSERQQCSSVRQSEDLSESHG